MSLSWQRPLRLIRHVQDRRRPRGHPPRLRRDAHRGRGGVGAARGPRRGHPCAPAAAGARGRLHRHGGLLRARDLRGPDPRGAAPLRGRHRGHEGRVPAHRPAAVAHAAAAPSTCGSSSSSAASGSASSRSTCGSCTASIPARRHASSSRCSSGPATRASSSTSASRRSASTTSRRLARSSRSPRSRTSTTSPTASPRTSSPTASRRASASSRGFRWPPASWPSRAARSPRRPPRMTRRRARSRWRGCCTAAR